MSDPIHADPYTRLSYWQERAERAEATVTQLREALERLRDWPIQDEEAPYARSAFREVAEIARAALAQDAEQETAELPPPRDSGKPQSHP